MQSPHTVWTQVARQHPRVVATLIAHPELVLPAAPPELRQVVATFGLPDPATLPPLPPPLPRLLLRGALAAASAAGALQALVSGSGRPPATVPFDAARQLPVAALRDFLSLGYVVARGAVPPELVGAALREINASIGRGEHSPAPGGLHALPASMQRCQAVRDLALSPQSAIGTHAQQLLGRGRIEAASLQDAQIGLRFPESREHGASSFWKSLRGPSAQALGGRAWHIDGFGRGHHSPFNLLVVVPLTRLAEPFAGNFAVHPGSHISLQREVAERVRRAQGEDGDDALFSFLDSDQRKPDLGEPLQLLLEPGDAVFVHQKVAHLGAPNFSAVTRTACFFRLRHVDHYALVERWLDDVWLPFDGLRTEIA